MIVHDKGHTYILDTLDGECNVNVLRFVKREGKGYPGNKSSYAGTTTQDVIRCLIDRTQYVDKQKPCWQNKLVFFLLNTCIYLLELRHWHKHKLKGYLPFFMCYAMPICKKCGHTNCKC